MYGHSARRGFCALILLLTVALPSAALAAPAAPSLSDKQAQAARAQAEMKRMQAELSDGMDEYVKVSAQLESTRREIDANGKRLRKLEERLAVIEPRLNARADYIYRTREMGDLDVLFASSSFEEFVTRFDLLSRMARADAGLIVEAKRARAETRELRTGLKEREKRLVALRDKSASEKAQLESSLAKQRRYFSSLSADVAAMLRERERAAQPRPAPSSGGGGSQPKPRSGNGLGVATVDGREGSYYVMSGEPTRYRATGVGQTTQASRYSVAENGRGTASGRPLDDGELTCAHKTLKLGTRVAITKGGRRIICVVTDRGPFSPPGRDLDLTLKAASLLGINGVGNVYYEVVVPSS